MLSLLGLAVAATAPPPVDPGWGVEGSGSRCALYRAAGAQTLMLRTYPGTGSYELILVDPSLGKQFQGPRPKSFSLSFAPGGTVFHRIGVPLPLKTSTSAAIVFSGLQHDVVDAMAKATALSLNVDSTKIANFPLPVANKVVPAFGDCEQAKLQEWGADPASFAPGATAPKPAGDPMTWLTAKDIGKAAKGKEGFAVLRLSVAIDGSISNCAPLETNNPALDTLACPALTLHARYAPARDAAGHPVVSVVLYIASWPCPDCTTVDVVG